MTYVCAIHILLKAFGTSNMRRKKKQREKKSRILNFKRSAFLLVNRCFFKKETREKATEFISK